MHAEKRQGEGNRAHARCEIHSGRRLACGKINPNNLQLSFFGVLNHGGTRLSNSRGVSHMIFLSLQRIANQ